MASPTAVIRAYLVMTGLYSLAASLIWGVNTLFLLDAGLSVFGVFIANAVFTGAMMVFEVPTGVVADTRGRRASFLLSVVILLVGTLGYVHAAWTAGGLLAFCAWSVVLGLGYTFFSGAVEAWLVDALEATGFEGSTDRVFAHAGAVFAGAMLVGTTSGGLLGAVDLSLPYLVRSVLLVALFGVAFTSMKELGFRPKELPLSDLPGEMRRILRRSVTFGWSVPSVRLLMLAGGLTAVSFAWGYHSWQPHFLALLGTDAVWIAGVIAALASLATMGGSMLVERLIRDRGKRTTLLMWGYGLQSAALLAVGLTGNFYLAVAFYLVSMAASGIVGPVQRAYMHKKIPSAQRATVVSFESLIASGASMGGQSSLGYLAQRVGFAPGYLVGGFVGLFALPMILGVRARGEEADRIIEAEGRSRGDLPASRSSGGFGT